MNPRLTSQLPSSDELRQIMSAEAVRAVPATKRAAHYPDFSTFVELLGYFDLDTSLMTTNWTEDVWLNERCLERGEKLMQQLVDRLVAATHADQLLKHLYRLYDYLAEEDPVEPVELIFVFGAKTPLRIQKAVELYQAGFGQRLVLSGRSSFSSSAEQSEAEIYKAYAIQQGVPETAILTETQSITVPDNVRSSLNLFDELSIQPKTILLVNSPYVQRRGWCLFKKYTEDNVRIIRQNCGTAERFSRELWYRTEEGIRVVANEYIKMKIAQVLNTA
jgi:hypothetical protein